MIFKKGPGWTACFDEERNLYTAERYGDGSDLYEISKEIFDQLKDKSTEAMDLISQGRHLYMDVNDRCGPPYTVVFDEDYKQLCPWADVTYSGQEWSKEMTDAVVEVMDSEKNNRKQRRDKKKKREKK